MTDVLKYTIIFKHEDLEEMFDDEYDADNPLVLSVPAEYVDSDGGDDEPESSDANCLTKYLRKEFDNYWATAKRGEEDTEKEHNTRKKYYKSKFHQLFTNNELVYRKPG